MHTSTIKGYWVFEDKAYDWQKKNAVVVVIENGMRTRYFVLRKTRENASAAKT